MRRVLLVLVVVAMLPWLWKSRPVDAAQNVQQQRAAPAVVPAKPAGYAGSETCALCHADLTNRFASNPHSALALMHGDKGVSCESCHGPGEAHVESGGDPTKILQLSKMSAKQINTTCLGCHASAHPNFLRSDHGKAGVSCTSCHSVHGPVVPASSSPAAVSNLMLTKAAGSTSSHSAPSGASEDKKPMISARLLNMLKPDAGTSDPVQWSATSLDIPGQNPNLLRASQPQLCYSCHTDTKSAFSQPFHHKVNEGLMTCSDCHDSHGTFGNSQLRSTADQNMICTKCHMETRGPFIFEHAPVKAEGCLSCHSPHGSQNARLLNVPNINQMCNQCHSPVANGTIHGMGAGSAEVQSCISCHTMIHGSNINPALIR